ncbi:MAG: YkgJ family cysteine cluster protein [Proteobacteria bacterium]|nr:YkgJ family cysteine cluster protein [Pseudomonadota bacterium]
MGGNETFNLNSEILRTYRSIDRNIKRIQRATSLSCPKGCGLCCKTQKIEATILEMLPLAEAIFENKEEETILLRSENLIEENDFSCALFSQDANIPVNGHCTYYYFRPLLCRLFGFAARKNRYGDLEFCTCRHIKESYPENVRRVGIGISAGMNIPVYQESFMRIAALNPGIGFKRLPINIAIKEALEYIYWRRPKRFKMAKAS